MTSNDSTFFHETNIAPLIICGFQKVPQLMSVIKQKADEKVLSGSGFDSMYWLTGSQFSQ